MLKIFHRRKFIPAQAYPTIFRRLQAVDITFSHLQFISSLIPFYNYFHGRIILMGATFQVSRSSQIVVYFVTYPNTIIPFMVWH